MLKISFAVTTRQKIPNISKTYCAQSFYHLAIMLDFIDC